MTKAIELSQLGSNITVDGSNIGIGTAAPAGTLHLANNSASIFFQETDASADNGIWAYSANSEELVWQARNDSLGGGGNLFKMTRTGNSIDTFEAQKSATTWLIADNTTRKVGIGTASPQYELDVSSTKDAGSVVARVGNNSDTGNLQSILQLKVGTNTVKYVNFNTNYTASYLHISGVNITTAYYSFDTHIFRDNAGNEKLRINSSAGNVGIGTDNPISKLEVTDSGDGASLLRFNFDRSWTFRQRGTGSTSSLSLQAEVGNKYFNIENVNQETNLKMYAATDKTAAAFVVGEDATRVPGIDLQNGYILVGTANYASNQNKPILIAGTTTWDGTTTNWGSYGFQMRLKSDSTGVARLTIDDPTGEHFCVEGGGRVGIGTADPGETLQVNGNPSPKIRFSRDSSFYWDIGHTGSDFQFESQTGGAIVHMNYDGNVGIGTISPTAKLHVNGNASCTSLSMTSNISQRSNAPQHIFREDGTTYGNTTWALVRDGDSFSIRWNNATPYAFRAGTSSGSVSSIFLRGNALEVNSSGTVIQGSLSKGSGSFRIQHPLPELSETTDLVHSFVEAPDASNLYAGMAQLTDGVAVVNIDTAHRMTEGTFVALNHVQSWSSSNESGYAPVKCSISGNLLTIECQDTNSTDTVYYEVRGIRKDQHMIDTDWTDNEGRVITEPPKRVVPE